LQPLILTSSFGLSSRFKELLIMVDTCQAATLFSQVCFTVRIARIICLLILMICRSVQNGSII
jgi:glycosylphosphatidylinositol transamidase (GPIT) subunit GPI8